MSKMVEILTSAADGMEREEFLWNSENALALPDGAAWSIIKRTLRGGASQGVNVVHLDNGALQIAVLPTRGMGVWKAEYGRIPVGWNSPVTHPVHPALVNLTERNGLGWLAGFNELVCRCGLAWNGPPGVDVLTDNKGNAMETPLTLHGKIANTPAHHVEVAVTDDDGGWLSVTGIVDEAMLFGGHLRMTSRIETQAGSHSFRIFDEVTNRGGQAGEVQLLYHTNIGPPFLEAGSRFAAAVREVAPINSRAAEGIDTWREYAGPTTGYVEQVYLQKLMTDDAGEAEVLLRNAAGDRGLSLQFDHRQLPCFTLWKNTQAEADGYVTGLEPATNYPNLKTFEREQGRVVTLAPGATFRAGFEMTIHTSAEEVAQVESAILERQSASPPVIHREPRLPFSSA